jgi:hypothetical protein
MRRKKTADGQLWTTMHLALERSPSGRMVGSEYLGLGLAKWVPELFGSPRSETRDLWENLLQ